MATRLETLKTKRDSLRRQINKTCVGLETIAVQSELNVGDMDNLTAKLKTMNGLREKLNKFNCEIEPLLDLTDFDKEFEVITEYDDRIELVDTFVNRIIREFHDKMKSSGAPGGGISVKKDKSPVATDSKQPVTQQGSSVRLPPVDIPPFDGNFKKWSGFWNQFNNAVGRNCSLTKADKLQFLISRLRGPPLDLLNDIEFEDDNFDVAVNQLVARYGAPEKLLDQYMDSLLLLEAVDDIEDVMALRNLESEVQLHVSALQKRNMSLDLCYSRICKLFPWDIMRHFRPASKDNYDMAELLEFLATEVSGVEERKRKVQSSKPDEKREVSTPKINLSTPKISGNWQRWSR